MGHDAEQRVRWGPRGSSEDVPSAGDPPVGRVAGLELVVFVGLQASGKSTFFRERFAGTHEHVSKDLLRNNRNPSRRQRHLLEAALEEGRSVVVDNTNPTPEDRRQLVELGHDLGAAVVGYYFESGVGACLERNRERVGRARVPDVAIYATAKRLVVPTCAEAFDDLLRVRIAGRSFRVDPFGAEPPAP